ncbi:hypothetical protein ACMHYT_22595 [Rhodococcus qingshengii]|nr:MULTISPECIES: hypothetical protein [Rhodococcus]MDI9942757.1 hypothetical protein [Rhodococcus sp. IEGM 1302]MDT9662040.1 hypothetical protein [Rhodococcus qingshengii]MEA1795816.1 hypothetical protein [Rhodococcus qingshengii]WOI89269.1 hypothetical protein R0122_11035 [Rhodococcus qingshengii]
MRNANQPGCQEFHHSTMGTSQGVQIFQLSPSPYGGIGIMTIVS